MVDLSKALSTVVLGCGLALASGCGTVDEGPGPTQGPGDGGGSMGGGSGGTGGGSTESPASLLVDNESSFTIWYLFVSQCGSPSWGDNQLGAYSLDPGYTFTLTGIPAGCWDFLAESDDQSIYWERDSNGLLAGQTFTWTLSD